MSAQHTPGRLREGNPSDAIVSDQPVHGGFTDEARAYYGGHLVAESVSTANRRRIIACWNACESVPTEVLEAQQAGGLPWNVADQIDARLRRDELLAALKRIADPRNTHFAGDAQVVARAAIAKVKGGAA